MEAGALAGRLQGAAFRSFPTIRGSKVALKDLLGKKNLVLYFYPKDMTPGMHHRGVQFP